MLNLLEGQSNLLAQVISPDEPHESLEQFKLIEH
jgi:hypothetical protein